MASSIGAGNLVDSSLGSSSNSTSSGSSTTAGTGLGQGINVNQFVQMALANDQANITNLQDSQTTINSESSALAQITSELNALQTAAAALSDPLGALSAQMATSSNTGALSATAASTATSATHMIKVTSLATTSSSYSDELPTSSTALTGSLQISVGAGTAVSIPADSADNTTTLNGLVEYINSQSNLGVTASVVQDANGARLALLSNTSGAPGNLTVTGSLNYTDANNAPATANFNQGVQGTNAALTVDGIPISSASNTVSNVINGVTLTLNSASPNTTISLVVAPDTTQATTAINQFVSAYNTAVRDINSQFKVNSDGSGGGALGQDNSVQRAQTALLQAISYSIRGNSGIVNLASMGVDLNDDGTLTVDNSALSTALSQHYSAVQTFLQTTGTGFTSNLTSALNALVAPKSGSLTLDSQGLAQTSRDMTQQISDLQAALATKQQSLIQIYAQVNTTLQELPLLQNQVSQQLGSIA